MSKNATITGLEFQQTWESQNGTMYQFYAFLDDGTEGQVNAKSETPWYDIGSEVLYDIAGEHQGISKLKFTDPTKPQFQGRPSAGAPQRPAARPNPPQRGQVPMRSEPVQSPSIHGATVGAAVNHSFEFHTKEGADVSSTEFWQAVYETASDFIRVCRALEAGKLCPNVKARNGQAEAPAEAEAPQSEAPRRAEPAANPRRGQPQDHRQSSNQVNKDGSPAVDPDVPY